MVGELPDFLKSEYVVLEKFNIHLRKDAPLDIVEKMRNFRKQVYGDENIYGEKDYKGVKIKK